MTRKTSKKVLIVFCLLFFFVGSMFIGLLGSKFLPARDTNGDISSAEQSWNYTWRYRRNITITEPNTADRTFFPVDIFLTFDSGTCINNSVRVNQTFDAGSEVVTPCQVWNVTYEQGTSFISSATVTFLVNVSQNSDANFSIYYSDAPDPFPIETYASFGNTLSTTFANDQATIENEYYTIGFDEESGVYNFTLSGVNQNVHTNYSLAPDITQNRYQENQYVMVRSYQHLVFIAKEEGTIRLYDGTSGDFIASRTLDQYEVWRYPDQYDQYFSRIREVQDDAYKLIRIDSDIDASCFITGLGSAKLHGYGAPGSSTNYYSGVDSYSDDDIYSAAGTDLLLWIPRDCYITAYRPTQVQIIDFDTDDTDSDDSKTLILGDPAHTTYGWGWNTSRNPLIYTTTQYYSYDPDGDPSGNDYLNPDIFDNDIVRIVANDTVTVVAGYCANDYQTEVMSPDSKTFHFPILRRFAVEILEDDTDIYFSNLTNGNKLKRYGNGYAGTDITVYRSRFSDFNRFTYNWDDDEIINHRFLSLYAGDTLQFYDWDPDYNKSTGTRDYDGTNAIYDRWGIAPDFYALGWANVTATKPIKVYVYSSGSYGDLQEHVGTYHQLANYGTQLVSITALENNTVVDMKAAEDPNDDHTTIVKSVDLNQNDGSTEVIVGSTELVCYNSSNGNRLWDYPIWAHPSYGTGRPNWEDYRYKSDILTANLTGDEWLDVIVSISDPTYYENQHLLVLDGHTGDLLWSNTVYLYGPMGVRIGDITNDTNHVPDIITFDYNQRRIQGFDGETGEVLFFQYNYWGYTEGLELIDSDGDGYCEAMIIATAYGDGRIVTFDTSEIIHTSWSSTYYNYYSGWSYMRMDYPDTNPNGGYNNYVSLSQDFQFMTTINIGNDIKVVVGASDENVNSGYIVSYAYDSTAHTIGATEWTRDVSTLGTNASDTLNYAQKHRPRRVEVVNLDNSSSDDLVVGFDVYEDTTTNFSAPTLWALNGSNGNILWYNPEITGWVDAITSFDIDNDGLEEYITATEGEDWYNSVDPNRYDYHLGSRWDRIYRAYSNITLINSTGNYLWNYTTYKSTYSENDYVRSLDMGWINEMDLGLYAGVYGDEHRFYAFTNSSGPLNETLVNLTLCSYWSSIQINENMYENTYHLDAGEMVVAGLTTTDGARLPGTFINSTKPVLVVQHGPQATESIIWIPITGKNVIQDIQLLDNGPIFSRFAVTWKNIDNLHTEDIFTFYNKFPFWKINRTQYTDGATDLTYRVINGRYTIPMNDSRSTLEGSTIPLWLYLDGNQVAMTRGGTALSSAVFAEFYDTPNVNNATFGLFLTKATGTSTLNFQWQSQYKRFSELLECDLSSSGPISFSGGANNAIMLEIWEMGKQNLTTEDGNNGLGLFADLQTNKTLQAESQWFDLKVKAIDLSGNPIPGANVTIINATRINSSFEVELYNESKTTGTDGLTSSFSRILKGTYEIIVSYTVPKNSSLIYSKTTTIQIDSETSIYSVTLDLVKFQVQVAYESNRTCPDEIIEENYLENAIVSFTNSSTGELLANVTTDSEGVATLIWNATDSTFNYSVQIESFGTQLTFEEMALYYDGFENYSQTIIEQGFNDTSGTTSEHNINSTDSNYWVIESNSTIDNTTIVDIYFTSSVLDYNTICKINVSYWGFLNTSATDHAYLKVWDYSIGDWGNNVVDINSITTSNNATETFDRNHVNTELGFGNEVIVRLEVQHNDSIKLNIDSLQVEYITLTGSDNTDPSYKTRNFSVTSDRFALLNATGLGGTLSTYLNFYPPYVSGSRTVTYGETFETLVHYNSTNKPNGIDGATGSATIKYQGNGSTATTLSLIPGSQAGVYNLTFNSSLLAAGSYSVTIEVSKTAGGYPSASVNFDLTVSSLTTAIVAESYVSTYYSVNLTMNVSYVWNSTNLADWTLSYVIQDETSVNDTIFVTSTLLVDGVYILNFSTDQLDQGVHQLVLNASKQNHTTDIKYISLEILGVPTTLNGSTIDLAFTDSIYVMIARNYSFTFKNNLTDQGLDDLTTLSWTIISGSAQIGSGNLDPQGNGNYVLDLDTENLEPGTYTVWVTFFKPNYQIKKAVLFLTINERPINWDTPLLVSKILGEAGTITITLTDYLGAPLTGSTITLHWGSIDANFTEESPGTYTYSFIAPNTPGPTTMQITITKGNHTSESITITIYSGYRKILGLDEPIFYLMVIIGLVAVIAPIVAIIAYTQVKKARIPYAIKKIDETIKWIEKQKKKNIPTPVMKSKDSLFEEIFKKDWGSMATQSPLFAKEAVDQNEFQEVINQIKAVRMTTTEVELLKTQLKEMNTEEAIKKLRALGIPPDTAERLIKLAKK